MVPYRLPKSADPTPAWHRITAELILKTNLTDRRWKSSGGTNTYLQNSKDNNINVSDNKAILKF